jgi:hypothetical protein
LVQVLGAYLRDDAGRRLDGQPVERAMILQRL